MPPPFPLPPAGSADSTAWSDLASRIDGEVLGDPLTRMLYATDASPYEKLPLGVVRPRHREDCIAIVLHAARHRIPLIPRAAGTSLAGQCVGKGLVVDVSRHMRGIVEIDVATCRARVQPGVILEDLNDALGNDALGNDAPGPHGLQFAPDTSTANRCMIAGMIGNNACGAYSIRHGTTRDHVIEIEAVLADGTLASFGPLDGSALEAKRRLPTLEGRIYREVFEIIDAHRELILQRYPRPEVVRRNTGYALDVLARGRPWVRDGPTFNLARLLCGSEGTLALVTEATLRLVACASGRLLLCPHFDTLMGAMRGTLVAVRHGPAAVELIDRRILEETRQHLEQRDNRFWIEGDPEAVLIVEFQGEGREALEARALALIEDYRDEGLGYAFPIVRPPLAGRVWDLRKAGLGLLMNRPGRRKAVTVIEDTAVALADLPEYVTRIQALMEKHGTRCVYYGHASVGLLHFRPELDLKDAVDRERFRSIAREVADLVAEYGGSLSGEHGDGRLRAPFVERMLGSEVHVLLKRVKSAFDPEGIFNPQKVLGAAPPLDRDLRAAIRRDPVPAYFDWHEDGGLLGAAERCNGSGACRKRAGRGTMCPSYMATVEETHGTRGRANVFRQLLTQADGRAALSDERLRVVLDLCLLCKGCKSECPASVDMARIEVGVPAALPRSARPAAARAGARGVRAHPALGGACSGTGGSSDERPADQAPPGIQRGADAAGAGARDTEPLVFAPPSARTHGAGGKRDPVQGPLHRIPRAPHRDRRRGGLGTRGLSRRAHPGCGVGARAVEPGAITQGAAAPRCRHRAAVPGGRSGRADPGSRTLGDPHVPRRGAGSGIPTPARPGPCGGEPGAALRGAHGARGTAFGDPGVRREAAPAPGPRPLSRQGALRYAPAPRNPRDPARSPHRGDPLRLLRDGRGLRL